MLSLKEVRNRIKWMNEVDLSVADFCLLREKFRELACDFRVVVDNCPSTECFFRVRVNPKTRPTKISELMAPPAEFVTGYQRCNGPSVPMFYTASRRLTALLECRVEPGDKVYMSQWISKTPVPINSTVFSLQQCELEQTETELLVQSYIETIFTRRVDPKFSDDYKLTAALSQNLTSSFAPSPNNDIREDGTVGLRYRSIVDITNSYNTVFHSEFSRIRLEPLHVMEMQILAVNDRYISYIVLDNAVDFSNGDICWMSNPNRIPMLQCSNREMLFIHDSKAWKIRTCETEPTQQHLDELLSEYNLCAR
jgi:hypothetical protein